MCSVWERIISRHNQIPLENQLGRNRCWRYQTRYKNWASTGTSGNLSWYWKIPHQDMHSLKFISKNLRKYTATSNCRKVFPLVKSDLSKAYSRFWGRILTHIHIYLSIYPSINIYIYIYIRVIYPTNTVCYLYTIIIPSQCPIAPH